MLTKIKTAGLTGVNGYPVTVETDLHRGMPVFHIVGLADTTIKEATQRIKPAIMNCSYRFPNERVTVNLVPAAKPKEGSHFDLPIALGVLMLGEESIDIRDTAFLGEISLDGAINAVKGVLPLAICLRRAGIKSIVLPADNAPEASILKDIKILPVKHLTEVVEYIRGERELECYDESKVISLPDKRINRATNLDFSQVIGQESVKRAIVIGASGNHGIMMMGGPGCGKTMMAKRIPSILPELNYEEQLELTGIYSVAGLLSKEQATIKERPFRSPHHSITQVGLIGGGNKPKPGELPLAHRGILFLDEFGEFDAKTIDSMRQAVEDGEIRIVRSLEEYTFPSKVMVVVASNPCKCGYLWDEKKICTCSHKQIDAYRRKLMGPFSDRIDMHIKVNSVDKERLSEIRETQKWESSASMKDKVQMCRGIQKKRYIDTEYNCNGDLDEKGIRSFCELNCEGQQMMIAAYEKLGLSMRGYNKLVKVARTIADLDSSESIRVEDIAEALMYRVDFLQD